MSGSYNRQEFVVFNGEGTFDALAHDLRQRHTMAVDWMDQRGTQLALLFALRPTRVGPFHGGGGLDGRTGLYVAIAGKGMWRFTSPPVWPYVAEKLHVAGGTAQPLADLISAVMNRLEG